MFRLTHLKRFMVFKVDICPFNVPPMICSNKLDLLQVFFSVPEVWHPPSIRLTRPLAWKMVVAQYPPKMRHIRSIRLVNGGWHPPCMRHTRQIEHFTRPLKPVDTVFRVVIISSRETIILFYPVVYYGMSSLERDVALFCILALFVAIILRHLNTYLTNCL